MSLCRHFENSVYKLLENKTITIPVYLSAGQESIPATVATICQNRGIKPLLFGQHRCHSWYLSFGGDPYLLARELLGKKDGLNGGKGGSASISSKKINMYGHSGFMGDNIPIGIGACYASKEPTICFAGDGAFEEDYVLGSLNFAALKGLPILFICEDNNRSILTEKKVRRTWNLHDVGNALGLHAVETFDLPDKIEPYLEDVFKRPILLNVLTNRLYFHAGAGMDDKDTRDRYKIILDEHQEFVSIDQEMKKMVNDVWQSALSNP